ncbi:LysR family transcriptional regulator [Catellatospora sp. TT07R-123]|uniref:LysR family transcriptional regulator n=1 Tax=Catellatospora sp. TT07R-123 TaxID=2733863 RepID=UPI001B0B5B34|nr:LysR family transcriptional regulator [Catellatospora sp. TT07R-123]GHJ48635.1 LysR family transcriptional regulator [Catellatospora sp. TT07R-123]
MIDVQRLRILREVAAHGSFSRAASALLLTPSAVSQHIAALERSVGTEVVARGARGTELTPAGRVLVESAEVVLAELTHARVRLDRLAGADPDLLTVATFVSGGQRLLPPALTRLAESRPGLETTVLEHEPEESLALVRQGKADLALAYHFDGPPPVRPGDRSGLLWTPLLDDPLFVVLPPGHPLSGHASLALADLAEQRWVQGCQSIADLFAGYAAIAGFAPRISCRATDYGFALSLVAAGVGIGVVPSVALVGAPPGVTAIRLAAPCPTRYLGAVTAPGRTRPVTQDLLHTLQQLAAPHP